MIIDQKTYWNIKIGKRCFTRYSEHVWVEYIDWYAIDVPMEEREKLEAKFRASLED